MIICSMFLLDIDDSKYYSGKLLVVNLCFDYDEINVKYDYNNGS